MSESATSKRLTGDSAVLARRYAGALYELADEAKQTDIIAEEMRALKKLQEDCIEFRQLGSNLRLSRQKQTASVLEIAKASKLSTLTSNLLMVLAQNRRLNILAGIVDAFFEKRSKALGEHHAEICTAQALSYKQEEKLRDELQKMVNGKVILTIKHIPALLGGLTIKIGSCLIDASLRGKLARLERQLKAQREAA